MSESRQPTGMKRQTYQQTRNEFDDRNFVLMASLGAVSCAEAFDAIVEAASTDYSGEHLDDAASRMTEDLLLGLAAVCECVRELVEDASRAQPERPEVEALHQPVPPTLPREWLR